VLGDELTSSQNSAVIVLFKDGSRVKLDAASRAKIAGSEEQPKVVLLSGTLDFKLVPKSNLTVTNLASERKKSAAPVFADVKAGTAPVPAIALAQNKTPGEAATVGKAATTGVAAVDSFPVLPYSQFLLPSTIATSTGVRAAPLVAVPPVSPHL
jgi:hypothetical protein